MGKKVNIERCLIDTASHSFYLDEATGKIKDNLSELLNKCSTDSFYYVGVSSFVIDFYDENPGTEWNLWGAFQIGFPFMFPGPIIISDGKMRRVPEEHPGHKIRSFLKDEVWSLFVFVKKDIDSVKISFNNSNDAKLFYRQPSSSEERFFTIPDETWLGKPIYASSCDFRNGFTLRMGSWEEDYFNLIQKTIEKGHLIERNTDYESYRNLDFEFNEIPIDDFYINYLKFPYRYKESVIDSFGLPYEEECVSLIEDEIDFFEDRNDIREGDILFNFFAINVPERKFKIDLSIAASDKSRAKFKYFLRPKELSSFYVFEYLKSDFLKEYILDYSKTEKKDVFEIFEEHKDDDDKAEYYRRMFLNLYIHDNDSDWTEIDIKKLPIIVNRKADTEYFKKKYEWEKQEKMALQRRLEKKSHSNFYNEDAKDIILRDMNELRSCFTSGTYKAAIILAGSILEAFLIDWLSEIHDKDFFNEDFMVFDKYRNKYRRADLKDYISSIAELKKPNWFDAASKATEIRKKRNLVHAKLYINDADISRETCTEVINYLEYVINTRWK